MVPERADTWTRMAYAGANKPITPIDDPYQMFGKLYGKVKDRELLSSVLDGVQDDLKKVSRAVSRADRRLLDEHATFVREMEQQLRADAAAKAGHQVPEIDPGVRRDNDNIPHISKLQIDLMVNSFVNDFARIAHAAIHQFGRPGEDALARHRRTASRPVARARFKRQGGRKADENQPLVLRATRVSWPSAWPTRPSRAATAACSTTR